ncbi:MAG: hypothetical protein GX640_15755 [Fibrobacter sp.]|nr:hypothetical protein [Fibrobacter sp.]
MINNALRNAHIYSIHLRTAPDIPYNLFYTVLKQINRSENRSLALCTDAPEKTCFFPVKEETNCNYQGDSIHLSVIVDNKSTVILWGNGLRERIPHYNGTINKLEIGSLLMKLSMEYRCATDIQQVTIAASELVIYDRILEIVQAAFNSGFHFMSFARMNPENEKLLYSKQQQAITGLFDTSEPVYYSSDISDAKENYFKNVMEYLKSIGKHSSKKDAYEYTGSILLVSFPPLAEVYVDSSFVGVTNRSALYFKPGRYLLHIRKGFQYAEQEVTIIPGENESISIYLHDLPQDLVSSGTPLFPIHFNIPSFRLTSEGKHLLTKFNESIITSQKNHVRMVIIQCTKSGNSSQKISEDNVTIVMRELQLAGISRDSISTEIRKVNEDYCIEAIYLTAN